MKISVLVTAYNCAQFLPDALASVRAQTMAPFEVIVADDASTDAIEAVIASCAPDARHLKLAHGGEGATRNRAIAAARGDVIAFLDGDDVWPAESLAARAACLERRPANDIAAGRLQLVDAGLRPMMRGDGSGPMIADGMSFGAALIRRPVFGRVGPVDETLRNGGDIDWFLRARECGVAIGVCEGVTLLYRRHGRSVSADAAAGPRIAEVVARSLRRRRTRPAGRSLAAWRAPAQEPD